MSADDARGGADLEQLAASFEARAERARAGMEYTKNGYLTRDSIGLQGMSIAFETAARELQAALAARAAGDAGGAS